MVDTPIASSNSHIRRQDGYSHEAQENDEDKVEDGDRRKVDMSMVTSMVVPSNSHVRCQDGDTYKNVGDKAEDGDISQVYLYHCLPPYPQHSYEPHVDYYPGIL